MVVFIDRKIARGIRVEINFNIFFNYSLDFDVENVILYEMLIINFRIGFSQFCFDARIE